MAEIASLCRPYRKALLEVEEALPFEVPERALMSVSPQQYHRARHVRHRAASECPRRRRAHGSCMVTA